MQKTALILGALLCSSLFLSACTLQQPSQSESGENIASPTIMHHMAVTDQKDFLNQMIPHHQEAIDTSKIIVAQTSNSELKKFAQGVIDVQTKEIAQMENWLNNWYQEKYLKNLDYQPMMGDLTTLKGSELEKKYISGMILHHEGAIEMAQQVLAMSPKPEIKTMADDIIKVQSAEVKTLQGWLETQHGDNTTNHMMIDHSQMEH